MFPEIKSRDLLVKSKLSPCCELAALRQEKSKSILTKRLVYHLLVYHLSENVLKMVWHVNLVEL